MKIDLVDLLLFLEVAKTVDNRKCMMQNPDTFLLHEREFDTRYPRSLSNCWFCIALSNFI